MRRRWSSMDNLMHRAVNRMRFAPQLAAAAVCQAADKRGAGHYRATSFRAGVLKLAVISYDEAAWLRPRLKTLAADLNEDLAADAIRLITLEVRADLDISNPKV